MKENLYNFYTANKHSSRKEIFDRFIALNRWLCNLEQNKTLKRKKGSGRIVKKATRQSGTLRDNQAKIIICSDPLFIGMDHRPNHSILHHRT